MIAPKTQYPYKQDREIGSKVNELFGCSYPQKDKQQAKYNLINDTGIQGV